MKNIPLAATSASEIARFLGRPLVGRDFEVRNITAFPAEHENSVCFLATNNALSDDMAQVRDVLLVASDKHVRFLLNHGYSVIESVAPKYDLALAVNALMVPAPKVEIHETAIIGPDVIIGKDVAIGPYCVLDGLIKIGDGCILGASNILKNDVTLDDGVRIHNGAVLGEDAYSFGFGLEGESVRFPCIGGVQIGKNVEIGNNVAISRGILQNTILCDSSRVNCLANIGQTVIVKERSLIMAQCEIGGRVQIGKSCWIGQSAVVRQGICIADRSMVGAGTVVVKDVPENKVVVGVPGEVIRDRY